MSVFRVRLSQGNTLTGAGNLDTYARQTGTITAASNATPIVITSASHGLTTGRTVSIQNVAGNTAANENWTITKVSDNTFSLNGSVGNGSYTSGGTWTSDSVSRTIDVPGPNGKRRVLVDGTQFTDCNFYKQFTYPTTTYDRAFLEIVSDDGTVYVPGTVGTFAKVVNLTITAGTTYTGDNNYINVLDTYGAVAKEAQVTVATDEVNMKINSDANAIMVVAAGTTQVLDFDINHLSFDNSESGASTATVEILLIFNSTCNS